jgi:hypothetical protein
VKSLNLIQSRSLILNQFNFEWSNCEKNQFKKKIAKKEYIAIKRMRIKFEQKKS